eukprot:6008050-Amphidinium_carterae.1
MLHHAEVKKGIADAQTACQAKNYEECGRQLGMTMHLVVIGGGSSSPQDSVYCSDHKGCAALKPLDGLCCP